MTRELIESQMREREKALLVAISSYRAVWDSWQGLDAGSVDRCRRAAMSAALAAYDEIHGR